MQERGGHNVEESPLCRVAPVRKLRRDHSVHIRRRPRLMIPAHDEKDVSVGKAPLLELDRPSVCGDDAQDTMFEKI